MITMQGSSTFFTFAYLRAAALRSVGLAKADPDGSNHHRVSAALFSAFAVEAHLNHIGEARLSFWKIVERKLSWREKLDLIAQHLSLKPDFACRPFETLSGLFKFRDRLAHGKNHSQEVIYQFSQPGDDFVDMDPKWLSQYWTDEAIEQVLADTGKIMEFLHEAAGFDKQSIHGISRGTFSEKT